MDFTVSARIEESRKRTAAFVDVKLIPLEAERVSYDAHDNIRLDLADKGAERVESEGTVATLGISLAARPIARKYRLPG